MESKKAGGPFARAIGTLPICLLLALGFSARLDAQSLQASAQGLCRDTTGQAIEGAQIAFLNEDSGATRIAVTGEDGRFRLQFLPLGRYRIDVTRIGFRAESRTGVELTLGREASFDFTLLVGDTLQRIEVVAQLSAVDATNPLLSTQVEAQQVSRLPLNGRDLVQLMQLQPGVQGARTDSGDILTGGKGTRISVSGARPSANVYMLDGTVINNLGNRVAGGATGSLTGVETIKEFRAYVNSYSAEFSRAAGGAFNIITKSGSNDWHGSLFAFHRNDNLDARNFFDLQRPEFRRHQFGGSLGGPIARDRTFFFASYEGFREEQGQTVLRTVPDADARRGVIGGANVGVAASVRPYLELWPLPTSDPVPGDGSALFTSIFSRPVQEDFANVRLDHQFSPADSLFARYTGSRSSQQYLSAETFPRYPNLLDNSPQFVTLQETKILLPWAVNQARLGFTRSSPHERLPNPQEGAELSFIPGEGIGVLTIPGFDLMGLDRNLPRRLTQNTFQFSNQLAITRSRHAFSAGVQIERHQANVISINQLRGEFRFASLRDLLGGSPNLFEGVLPSARDFSRSFRQTLIGWYAQDAWRLHPRLTLNLGLRHEFVTEPTEQHGRLNNLRSPLDPATTIGVPFRTRKDLFAPRAALAYDPLGDGKTVIRLGAGLFYIPMVASQWWNSIVRLPPFTITARATGAAVRFPDTLSGLSALRLESISSLDYDAQQPLMAQASLSFQREIAPSTVLTLAYAGSQGTHLGREADVNIGAPGVPVRRNPNFTRVRYRYWDARSFYNSLQVNLQRHFRGGAQFQVAYTWSKSVDDASSELGRLEFNNGQARTSDPFDRLRDRGLSSFDVRHNLTANFTWDLPGRYGRGWQVSGIFTALSGNPFTPIIIQDLDRDGTDDNEQRPNLRPGRAKSPVLGRPEQWFDPSAFESIGLATRGNLGRNTILGPGLAMLDLSLARTFRLPKWDALRCQFRAEVFNALNRTNFASPSRSSLEIFNEAGPAARPLANTGRITSTSTTSRQAQLALRFTF